MQPEGTIVQMEGFKYTISVNQRTQVITDEVKLCLSLQFYSLLFDDCASQTVEIQPAVPLPRFCLRYSLRYFVFCTIGRY